jgi:hypothetical protein
MMTLSPLRVVGGTACIPNRDDLRREAARRLERLLHGQYKARALATGAPVPQHIRDLALQYDFVVETLSALKPIPADFRSDIYWPSPMADDGQHHEVNDGCGGAAIDLSSRRTKPGR